MRVKAIIFDIGQTLVEYPVPLNWSALYRPAFESIENKYGLHISEYGQDFEIKNLRELLKIIATGI